MPSPLILASSSPYRRQLLKRLGLPFEAISPDIDESPQDGESPDLLVRRLARAKANRILDDHEDAVVIGSDQLASFKHDGEHMIVGKPGSADRAVAQLSRFAGQTVIFHTTVCVCWPEGCLVEDVPTEVHFRDLPDAHIRRYVAMEDALDCAGGFKAEGLGITLFRKLVSDDPTALLGLPMIATARMLRAAGLDPLETDG